MNNLGLGLGLNVFNLLSKEDAQSPLPSGSYNISDADGNVQINYVPFSPLSQKLIIRITVLSGSSAECGGMLGVSYTPFTYALISQSELSSSIGTSGDYYFLEAITGSYIELELKVGTEYFQNFTENDIITPGYSLSAAEAYAIGGAFSVEYHVENL